MANSVEMKADVNVEFDEASSRQQINSGESVKVLFGKLKKFLTDLKAVAFSGSYADLSDKPESLPANGGNADTVDGLHADIFLKNEVLQGLSTSINDAIIPEVYGVYSATPDFPTGYGDWGFLEIRRYGNTCYQTIRFDSNVIITRSKIITSEYWADWKRVNDGGNAATVGGIDADHIASKDLYSDTGINFGRMAGTDIGARSTAEGYNTTASGNYSHAEGYITNASGDSSHAEGLVTTASGNYSHAGGYCTKALKECEFAHGKFNQSNEDTLFSIGDGTADNARHNAFEITMTGGKLHDKDIAVDVSNPNLLINPDFKINQRGVSGTFSETGKYFVDRWRLVSGAVTVNADGTLTLNGTISQIFENAVGSNVTASVSAGTATYDDSTKTFSITGNGEIISWAKLEYGSNATQFSPPDTATELLKCMRYYEKIVCSNSAYTVACQYFNSLNNCAFTIPMTLKRVASPTSTIDYSAMSYQNSENIVNVSSARVVDYANNSVSIVANLLSPTTVCTHGWAVGFTIEIDAEIYN